MVVVLVVLMENLQPKDLVLGEVVERPSIRVEVLYQLPGNSLAEPLQDLLTQLHILEKNERYQLKTKHTR